MVLLGLHHQQAPLGRQPRTSQPAVTGRWPVNHRQGTRWRPCHLGHRMGRKDWLMLFNGALFSLVLTDLIPAEAVQHILLMTLHGLGHLFGIGAPPMHLPHGG
jgi:hypothetical protein